MYNFGYFTDKKSIIKPSYKALLYWDAHNQCQTHPDSGLNDP